MLVHLSLILIAVALAMIAYQAVKTALRARSILARVNRTRIAAGLTAERIGPLKQRLTYEMAKLQVVADRARRLGRSAQEVGEEAQAAKAELSGVAAEVSQVGRKVKALASPRKAERERWREELERAA